MHAKFMSKSGSLFPFVPCPCPLLRSPAALSPCCANMSRPTTPAGGHRRSALLSPSERASKDKRRTRTMLLSSSSVRARLAQSLHPIGTTGTLVEQLQLSPSIRSHHDGLLLASMLAPSGLRIVPALAAALALRAHQAKAAIVLCPFPSSVDTGVGSSAPTKVWQPLFLRG